MLLLEFDASCHVEHYFLAVTLALMYMQRSFTVALSTAFHLTLGSSQSVHAAFVEQSRRRRRLGCLSRESFEQATCIKAACYLWQHPADGEHLHSDHIRR